MIKTKVTYTTERGQQVELKDMEPSFLLNEINHHNEQIATLSRMRNSPNSWSDQEAKNLALRQAKITETVNALQNELASRDPTQDEAKRKEY
jgi:hypothetical protein